MQTVRCPLCGAEQTEKPSPIDFDEGGDYMRFDCERCHATFLVDTTDWEMWQKRPLHRPACLDCGRPIDPVPVGAAAWAECTACRTLFRARLPLLTEVLAGTRDADETVLERILS